jgi:ribosomal protein S18 acetylase RimI-like enzyme
MQNRITPEGFTMSELTIREMGQDEDFAAWFSEFLDREGGQSGAAGALDEHYLILSNEIGDWVGGLRYWMRGGVAHLVDVVVLPQERHQGHAHRLLAAFEERAAEAGGHVAGFWTDDDRSEGLLGALGWRRILQREDYIGHQIWALMEKRLDAEGR